MKNREGLLLLLEGVAECPHCKRDTLFKAYDLLNFNVKCEKCGEIFIVTKMDVL